MATLERQGGWSEAELSTIFLRSKVLLQRWSQSHLFIVTSGHWATISLVVAISCWSKHLARHLIKVPDSIITKTKMITACNIQQSQVPIPVGSQLNKSYLIPIYRLMFCLFKDFIFYFRTSNCCISLPEMLTQKQHSSPNSTQVRFVGWLTHLELWICTTISARLSVISCSSRAVTVAFYDCATRTEKISDRLF